MGDRFGNWMAAVFTQVKRPFGTAAVIAAGLLVTTGCGAYEGESEYPQQYQYVAPAPPTAAELAAQQQAREQAAAESREILIGAEGDEYSDTDPSALTEFKPALDGHGTWVEDASYGTVWVPASTEVGTDFQPYVSAGHWTYSDTSDYVWVSDYSWGWAPFHYGRWVLLPGHGWSWIPGRRYAGAWVTWRTGPAGYGYVGWAPMGPSWYWYRGSAIGWSYGWYHHHDHYVYCPSNYVYHGSVNTYAVRGPAARDHYGRTQDYRPASPGVGGGDRVVANPSVGGGGRVVANPAVGGSQRVVANPGVKGPRPDELGLKNDSVVAPPSNNQGLSRAQAFASPTTAVAAGAAAPAHLRPISVDSSPNANGAVGGPMNRAPASAAFVPGGSRSMAAAAQQPNVANNGRPSYTPPSAYRSNDRPSPPPSAYRSTPNYYGSSSPPPSAYRSTPNYGSSPPPSAYRSTPSFGSSSPPPSAYRSTPSFGSSSPSFRSSSPAVRSSPSFRSSSPSFRSSSPAVRSSPSFRSSSPSFRSSSPAVRSSPSFGGRSSGSSFRSSSPSVRSSPSFGGSRSPSRSSAPSVRGGGGIRRR